jgi:hypothetical protein
MRLIAPLYKNLTTTRPIFITNLRKTISSLCVSIKSITRAVSPFRLRREYIDQITRSLSPFPTSATNKSTGSVFAARRTEAVCCGASNKSATLTSRIKETTRNEEITSACICHAYLRGVRCTVRGCRIRQCRRLFSNKPCFGPARPRNNNRLQPGEPRTGSSIWISNQGANMAPLYRKRTPGSDRIGRQRIDGANGRHRN